MQPNKPDPTMRPNTQLDITDPIQLDELYLRQRDGDLPRSDLTKLIINVDPNDNDESLALCHIIDEFDVSEISPEAFLDVVEGIDPNTFVGSRLLVALVENELVDTNCDTYSELIERIDITNARRSFGPDGQSARWNLEQIGLAPKGHFIGFDD